MGSLRVVEGEDLSVVVSEIPIRYGKRIFYRLLGDISKSDISGSRLTGSIRVSNTLKSTIKIEFLNDGKKELPEEFGIEICTDKNFQHPIMAEVQNVRSAIVFDSPSIKQDLITGIQYPHGDLGPKAGNFTLGLYSKTNSSNYGLYFAEFKPDLSKISLFADSNRNGEFDKKDAFLDAFKITSFVDLGEFGEGVPRTFEYRQNNGEFLLKYGGQTYLEASGDMNLF